MTVRQRIRPGNSGTGSPPRSKPDNDGRAAPGMVLTIRYDATGETETFLLGRRFGDGTDLRVYSTLSPLGHAIAGARTGEQRVYQIAHESRPAFVTLLEAASYPLSTRS